MKKILIGLFLTICILGTSTILRAESLETKYFEAIYTITYDVTTIKKLNEIDSVLRRVCGNVSNIELNLKSVRKLNFDKYPSVYSTNWDGEGLTK